MCVLNRRIDVAKICLGKMGLFRGTRALRLIDHDKSEAKLAMLAVHLNMKVMFYQKCSLAHALRMSIKEEAEKILIQSKQYDALNQLYQSTNEWEKAIDICVHYDRIHLRNTYYNYAKHLEGNDEIEQAIEL
jgi:intraflagellar transport protein 140